jgi:hypothetical protein
MTVAKKTRKSNTLLNEADDPKLIKSVMRELRRQDAKLILAKLEDLEKAIYHIAGKQQDMLEGQKELEKVVVATATTLEEMVNGFDVTVSAEENLDDTVDDTVDEDFLVDAWGGKKKTVTSTSN